MMNFDFIASEKIGVAFSPIGPKLENTCRTKQST